MYCKNIKSYDGVCLFSCGGLISCRLHWKQMINGVLSAVIITQGHASIMQSVSPSPALSFACEESACKSRAPDLQSSAETQRTGTRSHTDLIPQGETGPKWEHPRAND